MTNKIVVALACLGFAAQAGAQTVEFDKGVDIKSAIEQAKNTDVKAPYPYYGPHRVRYSRDCRSFSFGSGGLAQSSNREYLSSTEYIEECRFVPNPPPPPPPPPQPQQPKPKSADGKKDYYPGQPGYNNDGPNGNYSYPGTQYGQQGTYYCHERMGQTFRATAQLNIAARELFPWESENFEVCMEADRVDFNTRTSPYSYHVDRQGLYDLTFNLTPNYRVPTAPDENGLYSTGWAFRDGKFVLSVGDRWSQYYPGEKVVIKVELIKDGFLFFNSSQGEKEFTFDVANGYELSFVEGDLTKTKDFVDTSGDMRGAKKFFAKWGFKRVGTVSTQDYIKKGDTDKITK